MIYYISGYIKSIFIKMLENNKIDGLTLEEVVNHYQKELNSLEQAINIIDEQRNELSEQRAEFVKQYKNVAQEYKLMIKLVKKLKPDIKGEDIVNDKLFFSDSSMDLMLKDVKGKLTSTEALKKLFEQYPDELFEATKLRDQIEWLSDNKLLKNKSDNLQGSTHSSLKVLLKQKYVKRIEQDGKTYYKRRQP